MEQPETSQTPNSAPSNEGVSANTGTVRDQRLADYLNASLEKPDAFEASLGAVNAGLMSVAHRFQHVLDEVMQQPPETLAEMAEFMPGIDSYLRVVKQVDRFSQLAIKLKAVSGER